MIAALILAAQLVMPHDWWLVKITVDAQTGQPLEVVPFPEVKDNHFETVKECEDAMDALRSDHPMVSFVKEGKYWVVRCIHQNSEQDT